MATLTSHSPEETERFGRELGRGATAGCVFGIVGNLGSGKTRLAQGIARGLGVRGRVPSPSFALVYEHRDGRLPVHHLDLYRLDSMDQILAAGLGSYFDPQDGVSIVEWFERWTGPRPARLCEIRLLTIGETVRRIDYDSPCP